jgi:hypothetical protein
VEKFSVDQQTYRCLSSAVTVCNTTGHITNNVYFLHKLVQTSVTECTESLHERGTGNGRDRPSPIAVQLCSYVATNSSVSAGQSELTACVREIGMSACLYRTGSKPRTGLESY